jgi:hypothetical protein
VIAARSTASAMSTLEFRGCHTDATAGPLSSFVASFKVKPYIALLGVFPIAIDSELFKWNYSLGSIST